MAAAALLLAAGVAIAEDRVPGRGGRRALAQPDEDAVTLAVEAAGRALPPTLDRPTALIFATTTAPYVHGGSVQPLAELLGLQDLLFATELTATDRDGVAALRLATALATAGDGPVLVCAAHADGGRSGSGSAAVALLVGTDPLPGVAPLAELTPGSSLVEELRDDWQLADEQGRRSADRSFVASIGTERLGEAALADRGADAPRVVVSGPDRRAADHLERRLGGPGDSLEPSVGHVGAAHPLLRLLLSLDEATEVLAIANGMADRVVAAPTAAGAQVARSLAELVERGGREGPAPAPRIRPADFDPYASQPRAWRERDVDLRLAGIVGNGDVPGRSTPTGSVVTWVRDHVYPAAATTDMSVVDVDGGNRFFGQVASGAEVAIGDRVRLVPRRLHEGGGVVQYFWKVAPCR